MRLIDADYLKKFLYIGSGEKVQININKSIPLGEIVDIVIGAYRKCLFAELDKVPTAYDLDKVIKQLEDFAGNNICALRKNCPGDCGCEHCGAIGALEIVKAGKKG